MLSGQKYITPKRCLAERKKCSQINIYSITPKSDVDNLLIKHHIEQKHQNRHGLKVSMSSQLIRSTTTRTRTTIITTSQKSIGSTSNLHQEEEQLSQQHRTTVNQQQQKKKKSQHNLAVECYLLHLFVTGGGEALERIMK